MDRGDFYWVQALKPTIVQAIPSDHDQAFDCYLDRIRIYGGTVVRKLDLTDELDIIIIEFAAFAQAQAYLGDELCV